jgi:hypothetical protein
LKKEGDGRVKIDAGRTSERLQQAACHGLKHCKVGFPELDSLFLYRAVDGLFVMLCNRLMTPYRDFCHVASGSATISNGVSALVQLKMVPV